METIKQYIESLFIQFPLAPEVLRAKEHLIEMAEDKYTNLKEDGVNDNDAVAQVIAEFGNLDEIKDIIGLPENMFQPEYRSENIRTVSLDEVKAIEKDYKRTSVLVGFAVMCFICSVVPAIICDNTPLEDVLGGVGLFVLVGLGVMLCIIGGTFKKKWKETLRMPFYIELPVAEYVKDQKHDKRNRILFRSIGVFLICTCFVPCIIFDAEYMAALMFIMIGTGVNLIINSNYIEKLYNKLLAANPSNTVGSTYRKNSGRLVYKNEVLGVFMSLYWGLITCIYISISFLTFAWHITWIIWPIAAVIKNLIDVIGGEEE